MSFITNVFPIKTKIKYLKNSSGFSGNKPNLSYKMAFISLFFIVSILSFVISIRSHNSIMFSIVFPDKGIELLHNVHILSCNSFFEMPSIFIRFKSSFNCGISNSSFGIYTNSLLYFPIDSKPYVVT